MNSPLNTISQTSTILHNAPSAIIQPQKHKMEHVQSVQNAALNQSLNTSLGALAGKGKDQAMMMGLAGGAMSKNVIKNQSSNMFNTSAATTMQSPSSYTTFNPPKGLLGSKQLLDKNSSTLLQVESKATLQ